jgi:hypothetical protein
MHYHDMHLSLCLTLKTQDYLASLHVLAGQRLLLLLLLETPVPSIQRLTLLNYMLNRAYEYQASLSYIDQLRTLPTELLVGAARPQTDLSDTRNGPRSIS